MPAKPAGDRSRVWKICHPLSTLAMPCALAGKAVGVSGLTPSQIAMVGGKVREFYDRQAKERQREHAGTSPGKGKTHVENLPQVNEGKARDLAGKKANSPANLPESFFQHRQSPVAPRIAGCVPLALVDGPTGDAYGFAGKVAGIALGRFR